MGHLAYKVMNLRFLSDVGYITHTCTQHGRYLIEASIHPHKKNFENELLFLG